MELGFFIKKLLSAFLMPLSFSLILFLIGLIYLYIKSYSKAKIFLSLSFILTLLFTNSYVSNLILAPLENEYKKVDNNLRAKYIVLLGGDYEKRAYEVLRLYFLHQGSKIITSGYEGRKTIPEALINRDKLISLGIPSKDIIALVSPKDTQEEAKEIKKLLKDKKFFLVTSAYHMKRAMFLFNQVGLNPISAPSNYLIKNNKIISSPRASSLEKTEVALHEYLGLLFLKLKALFI